MLLIMICKQCYNMRLIYLNVLLVILSFEDNFYIIHQLFILQIIILPQEKVIMGMRPKLNAKWAPPEMVTKMIENSWKKEPNKRPTASELITTLEEIEATLIN